MNKMEVEGELDIHRDAENTAKRDLKMVALKIRTIRLQARECQQPVDLEEVRMGFSRKTCE